MPADRNVGPWESLSVQRVTFGLREPPNIIRPSSVLVNRKQQGQTLSCLSHRCGKSCQAPPRHPKVTPQHSTRLTAAGLQRKLARLLPATCYSKSMGRYFTEKGSYPGTAYYGNIDFPEPLAICHSIRQLQPRVPGSKMQVLENKMLTKKLTQGGPGDRFRPRPLGSWTPGAVRPKIQSLWLSAKASGSYNPGPLDRKCK